MSSKSAGLGVAVFLVAAILGMWLWFRSDEPEGPPHAPDLAESSQPGQVGEGQPGELARADLGTATAPKKVAASERSDVKGPGVSSAKRFKVSGRLLDAQQAPLADVGVLLDPMRAFFMRRHQSAPKERARSGADGRFEFWIDSNSDRGQLTLADQRLVIATEESLWIEPAGRDVALGDLTVETGAVLSGIVRGVDHQPLADVKIRLSRHAEELVWFGLEGEHAVTGKDGSFRFEGLRGGAYRLATASSRHVPASHKVEVKRGETKNDVVVELREGGFVAGIVLDDLGRAIAGAKVAPMRQRGGEFIMIEGLGLNSSEGAETDAQGRFFLGGLEDEKVTLRAQSKQHATVTKREVSLRSTDVVLTMKRHGSIEGMLQDTGGKPIAGSVVSFTPRGGMPLAFNMFGGEENKTDGEGRFVLRDVPAGKVSVQARGEDHIDTPPAEIEVLPGEATRNVKLTAQRGATVLATVVDGDGKLVEGAEVVVTKPSEGGNWNSTPMPGVSTRGRRITRRVTHGAADTTFDSYDEVELGRATTDAEGMARVAGLEAGNVLVKATHKELAGGAPTRLVLPAVGSVETKLGMVRGGFVEITVTDVEGSPIKQQIVVVTPNEGGENADLSGRTDSTGKVRIGPLSPGGYSATIQLEPRPMEISGGARIMIAGENRKLEAARKPFTLGEGETIELTLAKPESTIVTGIVSDAEGPVAGAEVTLNQENQPLFAFGGGYRGKTDKRGRFEIKDVPAGKYNMSWSRKDAVLAFETPLEILAGEREVKRDLLIAGGIVTVKVNQHDGEPLRGAKVRLERASRSTVREYQAVMIALSSDQDGEALSMNSGLGTPRTTDEDGVATIRDVPPGKYQVAIEHPKHIEWKSQEIPVVTSETHDLGTIKLAQAGQIRGTVVAADGSALSGFGVAQVLYQKVGEKGEPKRSNAMNYAFRLNGLEPGRYRVWTQAFEPEGKESEPVEVEVKAGETVPVQVRQRN